MPGLRLAFMGTPDFAVPSLSALAEAGHAIACVYTQPPRPAGRGHKDRPSPVQRTAEARGWPVRTPVSLKDPETQEGFAELKLDAAVVVAYGLILPKAVLEAPRLGCLNVHASLLPRWRGAAPIQRAILAGDAETGVTIMQMDEGLDTGAILLQRAVPIRPETTGESLHDELAALGAELIVEALAGLAAGTLADRPQDEALACYADKLTRQEGRLDWGRPAAELERQVRAFTPWPGAFVELPGGSRLKVLAAEAVLDAPRLGCFNLHASLLPRWRGAAPIQRAILAGDPETGVTVMQMDEGLDTGAILLQRAVPIEPDTTGESLHDELAALGAALIVEALAGLAAGTLAGRPQDEAGVTYADKLTRDDGRLDWRRPAADLARQVRALTPWPGAFAELPGGGRLKVLAAETVDGHGAPGAMLDNALTVACGAGALRLLRVQKAGKAPMEGAAFLRGVRLAAGAVLPCGPWT